MRLKSGPDDILPCAGHLRGVVVVVSCPAARAALPLSDTFVPSLGKAACCPTTTDIARKSLIVKSGESAHFARNLVFGV